MGIEKQSVIKTFYAFTILKHTRAVVSISNPREILSAIRYYDSLMKHLAHAWGSNGEKNPPMTASTCNDIRCQSCQKEAAALLSCCPLVAIETSSQFVSRKNVQHISDLNTRNFAFLQRDTSSYSQELRCNNP